MKQFSDQPAPAPRSGASAGINYQLLIPINDDGNVYVSLVARTLEAKSYGFLSRSSSTS